MAQQTTDRVNLLERRARAARARGAFTVLEVTVTSGLMVLLAMLVSSAWSNLGRPMVSGAEVSQAAGELEIALSFLQRDLCGQLPGLVGSKEGYGREVGRMAVDNRELWLCFDLGSLDGVPQWTTPDAVVVYRLQADRLVRQDQRDGSTATVASGIDSWHVSQSGREVTLKIDLRTGRNRRTFTLVSLGP